MGDSDDEYDRRRRDKFRRERSDYDRSRERDERRRGDDWNDREWDRGRERRSRGEYRDYDRNRRERFSPPRHELSPPQKRMRRDWDEHSSDPYHSGYEMPYAGGGGGPTYGPPQPWGHPDVHIMQHHVLPIQARLGSIAEIDLGVPPPVMKTFKEFLLSLDDSVDEEPEPEPTPGLVLSKPALEEDEGPRALSLLSLPPKKRSILGLGQARPLEFLRTCYGGSFLVHESFLYKREKAVADKVYWTCRDHALHSCRSRAITQGQRVTVMRGHCHPPDMEGLEARRQQEKAMETLQAGQDGPGSQVDTLLRGVDSLLYHRGPGPLTLTRPRPRKRAKVEDQELPTQPQAPEGSPDEDQDVDTDPGGPEFLKTPLGGSFLVYESFLYRREKAAGEKVYWTCRDQARMGCRSRAITQGHRVMVMRSHCHQPDLAGLEALRQKERLPSTAQQEDPEKIQVQLCFKTCPPESQPMYGDIKDVRLDGESQ